MQAYSLNPQILPGQPLTKKEHHRAMTWLVFAVIVLILGGVYFWMNRAQKEQAAPADSEAQLRSQVAAVLREASVQPTEQDVSEVASMLSKAKGPSSADRASVTALLKGNQ